MRRKSRVAGPPAEDVAAVRKKSKRAWTSPESAIARARDDLGPDWFKRLTSVGISEAVNEWIERLPAVTEMGREWFDSRSAGPFDLGTYFEIQRIAYQKMCRLAEKVEALEQAICELRDLAWGALAIEYECPQRPNERPGKIAERQKKPQPRTYELTDEVEQFVDEYKRIHEKTREAARHARAALRTLPSKGPLQLVARIRAEELPGPGRDDRRARGDTVRRAWSTLSREEVQRVEGLLVPRRSDLVRAVFERWPDARRIATSTWAYFGIGTGIDAVPRTAEEWDAVRAAWGTELRRARRPLKPRE